MFRHKEKNNSTDKPAEIVEKKELPVKIEEPVKVVQKTEQETIKELLEKNLKWSQIIYEQNRKINSKLMWQSIFGWIRVFLFLAPLVWAAWFLPGFIKNLQNTYGPLLGIKPAVQGSTTGSIEQLMKILPLDAAKQEQLKALLK